jgi:hypothetical protein
MLGTLLALRQAGYDFRCLPAETIELCQQDRAGFAIDLPKRPRHSSLPLMSHRRGEGDRLRLFGQLFLIGGVVERGVNSAVVRPHIFDRKRRIWICQLAAVEDKLTRQRHLPEEEYEVYQEAFHGIEDPFSCSLSGSSGSAGSSPSPLSS